MMNVSQSIASRNDLQSCHCHAFQETRYMIDRRTALTVLGTAGIGTVLFQRALAANLGNGPITLEMITDAEWVAGIKLTDAQRQTAVNALTWAREETTRVRAIEIDNSLLPGL